MPTTQEQTGHYNVGLFCAIYPAGVTTCTFPSLSLPGAVTDGSESQDAVYAYDGKIEGKTVTETFATPVSLRKAQQEVAEFHRFRELSQNLVEVNEEICRVRPVEDILTPQEKKRRKRSSRKSPGK